MSPNLKPAERLELLPDWKFMYFNRKCSSIERDFCESWRNPGLRGTDVLKIPESAKNGRYSKEPHPEKCSTYRGDGNLEKQLKVERGE